MEKLFAIAKVTQTSGLKGEVRVRPLSRFFEYYVDEKPLFIGFSKQLSRQLVLLDKFGVGKRIRYRFKGVNTRDNAEALIGQYLYAAVQDSDKIHWISEELIGFAIETEAGDLVGDLMEIMWLPSNDIYVIQSRAREILIPVIPEIISRIDYDMGIIMINPIDGLLD